MGTAGFGAELEHSRPIFVGGFRPDGFGRDEGLGIACSEDFLEEAGGVAVLVGSSATVGVVDVATAAASSGTVS